MTDVKMTPGPLLQSNEQRLTLEQHLRNSHGCILEALGAIVELQSKPDYDKNANISLKIVAIGGTQDLVGKVLGRYNDGVVFASYSENRAGESADYILHRQGETVAYAITLQLENPEWAKRIANNQTRGPLLR